MIYCCCVTPGLAAGYRRKWVLPEEPSGGTKHCLQTHDALRVISSLQALPQESERWDTGVTAGREEQEMSWHRGRHAWHQACVWVEMKPCAPAPTTTKAAGRHRAAASPLLLFAKPLILHYPIQSTGFSLNRLLYLRRSRKFAREIPSVSEWNITGCEPKGVWPESHSMEVHWCNITGLDDKDRPGASVKDI